MTEKPPSTGGGQAGDEEAHNNASTGITRETSQTKISTRSQILIVAAGFCVTSTTCSILFAYGVYQSLYEEMAKSTNPKTPFTDSSTAVISLIGTLAVAIMSLGAPFATTWARLYSPQAVIIIGAWVFGVAFILASFSQYLWQFALTQGVLVGMGTCMAFSTTNMVGPTWFTTQNRALAMGIIISGTGIGGMVWPPVLRALISSIGFRNTMRITGCLTTFLVTISGYILRWEPHFAQKVILDQAQVTNKRTVWLKLPRLANRQILMSRRFMAHSLGTFFQAAGYSTPLFFYATYAQSRGYSPTMAVNFITIHNASNFISRIAIGYAADRMGRLNTLFSTTLFSSVVVYALWLPSILRGDSHDTTADVLFIFFTILYGAFGSAYISLFPATLFDLFERRYFVEVNGTFGLVRGIGGLLGTPLTALLVPQAASLAQPTVYEHATLVAGTLLLVASLACLWARAEVAAAVPWKWKA